MLFCTFLSRGCTTTTWKCLISRFVEDGNTRQRVSFSFPELWYSLLEFSSRKSCQHLRNWARWTKRETVWSRATVLFQWRFRGRRRPCCLSSLSWNETGVKEPLTTVRWKGHDVIVYLAWDIIGLGGRGEIKYGLKRLHSAPLHGDVGFYLSAIGCKWESCFVDCCKKRKYTCKPVSAYDSLGRQDRKIFRNVSK